MTDHTRKNNRASIPHSVWPAAWLRAAEPEAAAHMGLTLYGLMQRAGEAAFWLARGHYPQTRHWLILCGTGNNGGDGYVVARLAKAAGLQVTLLAVDNDKPLPEEAHQARERWIADGGVVRPIDDPWPDDAGMIIDGLLGTGLRQAPRQAMGDIIDRANGLHLPIVALDIPSGLDAETGAAPGAVINAAHTLAFITLKPGLLTGKARDMVGRLHHDDLGLSHWLADKTSPIQRYEEQQLSRWLKPRRPTANKGEHGRLVIIGGDHGTAGAIRMTGEAALRAGAGLVRVLTRAENVAPIITARPELMVEALTEASLGQSLEWADVLVIGPGMGQQEWAKKALRKTENFRKPMLWDADALNLLAINPDKRQNRVITPHPGEAARLLNCTVADIERDRLAASQRLVQRYGGCVVLKGAGTLVADADRLGIIDAGNAGMATGGMGDVLSGIIGALLAQKLTPYDAVCAGCVAHGAAGDALAREYGMRGMLATDLFSTLYRFVNPEVN